MKQYPVVDALIFREKWEERYIGLAHFVSTWCKSPGTKVGCVIVRPNNTVCSVGFNGFPRGFNDAEHRYLDKSFKHSAIIHAEINALLHANEPVKGYTIYIYPVIPCDRCAVILAQAGIAKVVAPATTGTNTMGEKPYELARAHLNEGRVHLKEIHAKPNTCPGCTGPHVGPEDKGLGTYKCRDCGLIF